MASGEKKGKRIPHRHLPKPQLIRDDTHQEKHRGDGRRLQVRAESQQTAVAILHHELAAVPGHVAKFTGEFNGLGGVLGIKCVGVFHEEVGVEQFVRVFVRIGGGGAAQRK